MRIKMPEHVEIIINVLQRAGFEAYAVGGCVRDALLGRCPHDWDITTSAFPEQVKELFPRTIDTGLQHGTVTVMMGKEGYEVTTYRVDGEYKDGRHPEKVTFTASLEEDLKRRDFTINAMAYNTQQGLVDLFNGKKDLDDKIIRCVGDPMERFTEDALRIMRAVRFSAQLGFSIDETTKKALPIIAPNLKNVSAERIQAELQKILMSPNPDYLRVAYESGITKEFLPELDKCMETQQNNPHHCYTVGEHLLHSMLHIEADKALRFAMLLHDIGKPEVIRADENGIDHFYNHAAFSEDMAYTIMRRLKMDNDTIGKVTKLIRFHDYWAMETPKQVRKAMHKIGEDLFPDVLKVQMADILSQSEYKREEKLKRVAYAQKQYQEITENQECVSLRTLAVTGKDLIDAGMKPGKEIGRILERLMEIVLEDPSENEKDKLLEWAGKMRSEA